jgi:hypothetical protein
MNPTYFETAMSNAAVGALGAFIGGHIVAQGLQEAQFQRPAQGQQSGVPFSFVAHLGEAAVVEFVQRVESELYVVTVRFGVLQAVRERGQWGAVAQCRGERARYLAPRGRKEGASHGVSRLARRR